MACNARLSALVVDLTFGEVYDAPQSAPRSQPGLRPEPEKGDARPLVSLVQAAKAQRSQIRFFFAALRLGARPQTIADEKSYVCSSDIIWKEFPALASL